MSRLAGCPVPPLGCHTYFPCLQFSQRWASPGNTERRPPPVPRRKPGREELVLFCIRIELQASCSAARAARSMRRHARVSRNSQKPSAPRRLRLRTAHRNDDCRMASPLELLFVGVNLSRCLSSWIRRRDMRRVRRSSPEETSPFEVHYH